MKIRASVVRPDFVKATVLLIDGREITIDCNGLLARCLQHECDHLNGILFVERVSSAQKITPVSYTHLCPAGIEDTSCQDWR